jgi:hypothetical protein
MNTVIFHAFIIILIRLMDQVIFFLTIFGLGKILKHLNLSFKQYFLNKHFLMMFALAFIWSAIPIKIIGVFLTVATTWYIEKKIIQFNHYKNMMS